MLCYAMLCYAMLFYAILFYSILFYSILFYSILFYSILFYSILFYSILFYSILFYSILLCCVFCSAALLGYEPFFIPRNPMFDDGERDANFAALCDRVLVKIAGDLGDLASRSKWFYFHATLSSILNSHKFIMLNYSSSWYSIVF